MARTTIERVACDGCGKTLASSRDGVVVKGGVFAPDAIGVPVIGPQPVARDGALAESAWCWSCLHEHCGWAEPEPRVEYRTEYVDRDRPGGGPSGPLPPPEIRAVGVAAALCGLRAR